MYKAKMEWVYASRPSISHHSRQGLYLHHNSVILAELVCLRTNLTRSLVRFHDRLGPTFVSMTFGISIDQIYKSLDLV
jgi:hypothetical protein